MPALSYSRRLILFASLLFLTYLSVAGSHAEDWKRTQSKDGKISALFPVDLRKNPQTQVDRTPAGKVKSYFGEYHGDGILLAGSGADIPLLARAAGENAIFRGSKNVFLEQAQGTEVSFKETIIQNCPARILIYKGKAYQGKGKPYQGKACFIIVNKRMYIVNSVISKSTDKNKSFEKKLFDSINIGQ